MYCTNERGLRFVCKRHELDYESVSAMFEEREVLNEEISELVDELQKRRSRLSELSKECETADMWLDLYGVRECTPEYVAVLERTLQGS